MLKLWQGVKVEWKQMNQIKRQKVKKLMIFSMIKWMEGIELLELKEHLV